MNKQLISVGFGKQSFKTSSASLSAFVVEPEFVQTLPSKRFSRQGNCQRFPVSAYPEINGYLYLDSVASVPDGTVIMVRASHRFHGTPLRDGAIFIGLRSGGPMLSINAKLPSAAEMTISSTFLVFQGRGDLLSLEDLSIHGIVPYKNFITAYMDDEEVGECYTVVETAPAIEGKPRYEKAETRDGELVVVASKPARRISIRRKA
jgi:hypothetical protein